MPNLKPYAKALVAALGGGLTVAETFVAPTSTWGHVIAVVLGALTVAGVYAVRNTPAVPAAVTEVQAATKPAAAS